MCCTINGNYGGKGTDVADVLKVDVISFLGIAWNAGPVNQGDPKALETLFM
jgi:hypothetical protein